MKNYLKRIGIILSVVGLIIIGIISYRNSSRRYIPTVFSPETLLRGLWDSYKAEYIEPDTFRTLDRQQNNITTSEGQSYTLLRAVFEDDRETFDKAWKWTQDNLQHKNDALFAWVFGQKSDGSYGILTDRGGNNTASDADIDIAVALLFAGTRWQDPTYTTAAHNIITGIWSQEVIQIQNKPYLVANNIEQFSQTNVVANPSYCAPYAYRMFKRVDPIHDWEGVTDTCYSLLEQTMSSPLDTATSGGLPPDWVLIERTSGKLSPPQPPQTTHYGFDAFRVPFRLSLDYQWYNEPRAKRLLSSMATTLQQEWNQSKKLATVHSHTGAPIQTNETPAMYGSNIGLFLVTDPTLAEQIFQQKLQSLYNPDTFNWKESLSYYDSNWAWFGMALYYKALPNLFNP